MWKKSGGPEAGVIRAPVYAGRPERPRLGEETKPTPSAGTGARTRWIAEYVIYAGANAIAFGDTKEGTFAVRLNADLSTPNDHMLNRGRNGEPAIWGSRPIGSTTRERWAASG